MTPSPENSKIQTQTCLAFKTVRLELCSKPIQTQNQFPPNRASLSLKTEPIFPQSRWLIFPKSVAHFPKVGGSFSQSRWLILPKSVAHFPKVGGSFSQSRWADFPKSVAHSPKVGGAFSQSRWLIFRKLATIHGRSRFCFSERNHFFLKRDVNHSATSSCIPIACPREIVAACCSSR